MVHPIGGPPPPGAGPPVPPPSGAPEVARPRPEPPAAAERGTPLTLPEGWVGTATNKIVSTVDGVRAKTTAPIEKIGRIIIWSLLIATAGASLLVVLVVGGLRLLYEGVGNIPGISGEPGRSVWIIDVLFGVVLIVLGLLLVKKGTRPHED